MLYKIERKLLQNLLAKTEVTKEKTNDETEGVSVGRRHGHWI